MLQTTSDWIPLLLCTCEMSLIIFSWSGCAYGSTMTLFLPEMNRAKAWCHLWVGEAPQLHVNVTLLKHDMMFVPFNVPLNE